MSQDAAAKRKKVDEEKLVAETEQQIAAGRKFEWTFDRTENEFGGGVGDGTEFDEQPTAASDAVIRNMEKTLTSDEDQKPKAHVDSAHIDLTSEEERTGESKKAKQDGNHTTWNHMTRCMFLKCVAKYNPFAAVVKKDMWAKIAVEMAKSTAYLHDTKQGDFSVRTDGHGLQVFYERRRTDMDKKLKKEESTSGHGGFSRNTEDVEEHSLMQGCRNLENDAARAKTAKREHKQHLDDLKNNEVNDAIIKAAEDDEVVQVKLLKVLQARVRQAKLEGKIWEGVECNKGMKYTFPSKALKDIEDLDKLKKKLDPEGLASSDVEPAVRAGGSLAIAITSLSSKMPNMAAFKPVDPAEFARSFYATKQQMARTLQEKLDEVTAQLRAGVINVDEHLAFTKKVKEAHFDKL